MIFIILENLVEEKAESLPNHSYRSPTLYKGQGVSVQDVLAPSIIEPRKGETRNPSTRDGVRTATSYIVALNRL